MSKISIDFDTSANIKKRIKNNVIDAIKEFEKLPNIKSKFGHPVIGYVSAKHPLFRLFMEEELCLHPKGVYRPGNTVIVHFVPYSREIVESNRGGDAPSEMWKTAFYDSMHLAMYLNRIISDTLDEVGRLHSVANTPLDWNLETQQEEWSHKFAAYAAGIGRFGIGGSFHTEMGFAGRLGTVLTDQDYAPLDEEELKRIDMDNIVEHINTDSKYMGAKDIWVNKKAISACPANAITKEGIDKIKCQSHCQSINPTIPSREVCGKCFYFDM